MTTPSTLRELNEQELFTVFFNTDENAETVTYYPAAGGSRSVLMVIEEDDQLRELNSSVDIEMEILGLCSRSLSVTVDGVIYSGINSPRIGDYIVRSTAYDPEQMPYAWTGDIESAEPDSWWLRWRRKRTVQAGTAPRMQR